MTRLILRALNSPALVLLTAIAVALQTSLFSYWPLTFVQPDVVLVVVIWMGLRRKFTEGGIITLIIADIAELHSASPQGYYLILYMTIYFAVRIAYRILVLPNLKSYVYLAATSAGAMKILGALLFELLGTGTNQWLRTLLSMFPAAAVEGVFAYWAFRALERFDYRTFKHARSEHVSEHGDLGMDSELQAEAGSF